MSDLKIVTEPGGAHDIDNSRGALPVPGNDGVLTRRDLDKIKRDLITVRKDYNEIRENMIVLTHQYSNTPSRLFFVAFGTCWLLLMAALLVFQPQLSALAADVAARITHR
jgi:hypothetical protein